MVRYEGLNRGYSHKLACTTQNKGLQLWSILVFVHFRRFSLQIRANSLGSMGIMEKNMQTSIF